MSLQNEHTLHPVTALDFFGEKDGRLLLLAGEGPYLKVFEADKSLLVQQYRIFEGQTIHGIVVQQDVSSEDSLQAVVWGGSSISMFTRKDFRVLLQSGVSNRDQTTTVSDWILDVAISPYDDGSCVLITAHNTVLRASLGKTPPISLEELHSPSRSILYSAHLVWDSSDEILVAAGTVFGEIIAWKCTVPTDASGSKGEILFTFTGHEGSIFGVNISPPITFADQSTGRLLASCSDDRSIRVWDLSFNSSMVGGTQEISPRETGFGNDNEIPENRCLAVAMGHASRIWRVKFLVGSSQAPNLVDILSFGEDSTTQQWSLTFESDSSSSMDAKKIEVSKSTRPGQLQHQKSFAFHSGKHIGSAATVNTGAGQTLIATGGADGKISMYQVESSMLLHLEPNAVRDEEKTGKISASDGFQSSIWSAEEVLSLFPNFGTSDAPHNTLPIVEITSQEPISTTPIEENSETLPKKKKKVKKIPTDSFSRYAFTSENQVVAITTFGRIVSGKIDGEITWKELFLPVSAKNDLKSWSVIKSIPEAGLVYLAGANGKIYGSRHNDNLVEVGSVDGKVADMFVLSDPATNHTEFLVTTLAGSSMRSFSVDLASENASFKGQFSYELPSQFVVTSASIVSGGFLVLGSRYGSLAIYNHDSHLIQLEDSQSSLNGDAITSILPMPSDQSNRIYFLVTGRKGAYSIFAFNTIQTPDVSPSLTNLSLVHQGSPPFGPMIENAWFSKSSLHLYGFKSKNFIVWDETQQYEIMNVECGGAHRSYAYSPTEQGGHFIYTKALKLHLYSQTSPSHKIIKSGGHGREIKACAVSQDETLFATGAEDTAIRTWSYTNNNKLNCLAVVQKHTAGIQHLQWHKSSYLFSSGGSEEFFIWAVEKLPISGIGIMCEASRPEQSADGDLRIMNFDVTALPSTSQTDEVVFLISLAYSDSTIGVYTYSKSAKYTLVARGRYTSSCLLQIKHLQISKDNNNEFLLLTAATDGNLTFWKGSMVSKSLIQIATQKVHQSSIKTLDVATVAGWTVIATGGDDNAIAISLLDIEKPEMSMRVFMLRGAHAAAVTGLSFVPTDTGEGLRIVTSSNDQRVKEWVVKIDGEREVKIRKVGDAFTPVADVGDVACLQSSAEEGRKVLVVGNGMEVWRVGGDVVRK